MITYTRVTMRKNGLAEQKSSRDHPIWLLLITLPNKYSFAFPIETRVELELRTLCVGIRPVRSVLLPVEVVFLPLVLLQLPRNHQ